MSEIEILRCNFTVHFHTDIAIKRIYIRFDAYLFFKSKLAAARANRNCTHAKRASEQNKAEQTLDKLCWDTHMRAAARESIVLR